MDRCGARARIRTGGLRLRRPLLYPAELHALVLRSPSVAVCCGDVAASACKEAVALSGPFLQDLCNIFGLPRQFTVEDFPITGVATVRFVLAGTRLASTFCIASCNPILVAFK